MKLNEKITLEKRQLIMIMLVNIVAGVFYTLIAVLINPVIPEATPIWLLVPLAVLGLGLCLFSNWLWFKSSFNSKETSKEKQ